MVSISGWVGDRSWLLGHSDFMLAFFSTVAVRAEDGNWGQRFPALMTDLYAGTLPARNVRLAQAEFAEVRDRLGAFEPDMIVWDADNLRARPPWGEKIAESVTSLAKYFWTADGKPLLDVLAAALAVADERQADVVLR